MKRQESFSLAANVAGGITSDDAKGRLRIIMADTEAIQAEALLKTALDIGEEMLHNGAEVYRVEDSIGRICLAYGAARIDVFAIPSSIVATLEMKDALPVTQTRRIIGSLVCLWIQTALGSRGMGMVKLSPI